jgi:hypothetical protein
MTAFPARLGPCLGTALLPLMLAVPGGSALAEVSGQGQIPDPLTMLLPGASRPGADPLQLLQSSQVQRELGLNANQISEVQKLNQRARSGVSALTRTRSGPGAGISAGSVRGQELQRRAGEQDARQRIAQILTPAQLERFKGMVEGQPGSDPMQLLLSASAIQSLGLSSAQVQQLRQLGEQMRAGGSSRTRGGDPATQQASATRGQLEQQVQSTRSQLAEILSSQQLSRLQQIVLQVDPTGMADPEVEKRLDLTPAQKTQLVNLQEQQLSALASTFKPVRSRSGQGGAVATCQAADANRAALSPVIQQSTSRSRGMLNSEQQQTLSSLQGSPLSLSAPPCSP